MKTLFYTIDRLGEIFSTFDKIFVISFIYIVTFNRSIEIINLTFANMLPFTKAPL